MIISVPELSHAGFSKTKRKCDINAGSSDCFISFTQQSNEWNLAFTSEVPMGPVFDSRWECMLLNFINKIISHLREF